MWMPNIDAQMAFLWSKRQASMCEFEQHGDYWTTGCGEEVSDSCGDIYKFCPWCGSPVLHPKEVSNERT